MSALAYPYSEPYKLPAGLLALAVHVVFFVFLYLGISWRSEPPQGMEVEIWSSLPAPQVASVPVAPLVEQAEPPRPAEPPKPVEPPKSDIELAQKKVPKIKTPQPPKLPVQPKKPEPVRVDQKALAAEQAAAAAQAEQAERAVQAAQAELSRARTEREAAATGKVVDDYVGRIKNKIRSNIVPLSNVPDDAEAEFDVTLLPDGSVLSVNKVKPSGSEEYDRAVERAILKAHTLPLPPDTTLFNRFFRELHLKFRPKE